ncbi:MAG: sialidase family protein [Thermoplasmatota archaeon]
MRAFLASFLVFAMLFAGCLGPPQTGPGTNPLAGTGSVAFTSVRVNDAGVEPRVAIGPDGTHWVSTQDAQRNELVFSSKDGGLTWTKTPTDPQLTRPCCDTEIVVSPTGRVFAGIIDGLGLDIQYTDDGGRTWTASHGQKVEDQDREWLAVGGKDSVTGGYDVYMLWHNLGSGTADHEMFVSTSRDNGATFGPPIPTTPPGSQAWNDLQCADSGGPSNIFTNAKTGQVYAVFGTRSSVAGGCGASATQQFEINVVAATRMWVATSTDQGLTWTDSLAVDDSAAANIVGMQVDAGTIDNAGNVYVVYPESPQPYPDYEGAAVKYVWASPSLAHWSKPVTVEPAIDGGKTPGQGHILTHIAAGDPGKLAMFYLKGNGTGNASYWFPTVAETLDGLEAAPHFTFTRVNDIPAWKGTASALMGVCDPLGDTFGPASPAANAAAGGFRCPRASDVFGQAIGAACSPTFVWYNDRKLGNATGGTWVTQQTSGPLLCAPQAPSASAQPADALD